MTRLEPESQDPEGRHQQDDALKDQKGGDLDGSECEGPPEQSEEGQKPDRAFARPIQNFSIHRGRIVGEERGKGHADKSDWGDWACIVKVRG